MPEQQPPTEILVNAHRLVYFAAERTLMAWVRSALGMMALGFVIDRFGLVLHKAPPSATSAHISDGFSTWGGSLLVLVGALMALVATIRYWHFGYGYARNESTWPGHGILVGVIFTAALAILGFVIAALLWDIST